jgi:hypothetical protein
VFLDSPAGTTAIAPAVAELERQRAALEEQIAELKSRKSSMSESVYEATLEQLLIELAKISQRIRQGS